MSDEQKQPDDRAACDREAVLNEVLEALLAAEHHEAYEVVYRMWSAARATAPQATKGDERCGCCGYLVTDSEHRGCLRAAVPKAEALTEAAITEAVKQWFPDRSYQASFFARALLAAHPTDQRMSDGANSADSKRLDWLSSKASCNSSFMWLPTLFCRDLPDLRAAIDAAIAWKGE